MDTYNPKYYNPKFAKVYLTTVLPAKSDSDIIFLLIIVRKTIMCTLHLSYWELIDHLCINPILRIGLILKRSIDYKSLINL